VLLRVSHLRAQGGRRDGADAPLVVAFNALGRCAVAFALRARPNLAVGRRRPRCPFAERGVAPLAGEGGGTPLGASPCLARRRHRFAGVGRFDAFAADAQVQFLAWVGHGGSGRLLADGGTMLLGTAGASLIRHANLLPPIAVVVTVMDIWTVLLGGFVHQVQQKAPKVVEAASVAVPLPAVATKTASIALPLVGVGDWFFAAFFFALLWRFRLNWRASYWLATLLVALVLAGLALRVAWLPLALPGLPFLALAVLLPNWRFFRYTAEEKRALAVGVLFLLLLLALFTYAARQIR
jgi:hypothetical protein